ncbi:uncharacterized protein LOC124932998 [Impatiens glandulifera]|uniref:uncharacterized protein LOC124932998 n=1 Tax=Impatiens glandulifera TaxID=253017 RepID=UPI001FB079EC|nr:uncharacterized protein LOC124932998 [Impatiens glandulifera]
MSFARIWNQGRQNNDPPADKPQIRNYLGKIGQDQPRSTVMETSREELLFGNKQTPIAFLNSGGNVNTSQVDSTPKPHPIPRMYSYSLPRPMGVHPFNLMRSVVPNAVSGRPNLRTQSFDANFGNIGLSMPQATGDHLNGNANLLNVHQISNSGINMPAMFMRNSYAGTSNISSNWGSQNADGTATGFFRNEVDNGSSSFRLMGHQLKIKENVAAFPYNRNGNGNGNGMFKVPAVRSSHLGVYDGHISKSAQRNPIGRVTPPTPPTPPTTLMTPSYKMTLRKKVALNNFPSNVKSLLLSGLFDGIPVKYISWSRKENLRGIINSSGYMCGCTSCNFKNIINAYEFEIHAGCQTKHPNNHIYFQNGKTIYDVVRELKDSTPQSIFHTIKTVTGSPINLRIFSKWKGKYIAAQALNR